MFPFSFLSRLLLYFRGARPNPSNREFYEESRWEKLFRKIKEEPLIPLGCALTTAALIGASRSIRAGDRERTNRMFRARVYAQGFTIVAMVAGSMYWQSDRQKRREFDQVVIERKAKEKRDAWVRELEARDEEDKEMRAIMAGKRRGDRPTETMEKATEKVKGYSKKPEKPEEKPEEKLEDKWKEDPAEMQLGVASSVADKEKNKGIMGAIKGLWGGK